MKPIDERIEQILDNIATYQAVALEDYGVPAWQALPPASAPHLAFRPHCGQLTHTQDDTDHFWYWEGEGVYWKPHWEDLQVSGVCVSGSHAVDVPKIPTDEVWAKFDAALSGGAAVLLEPEPESTTEVREQPSEPGQVTASALQSAPIENSLLPVLLWGVVAIAALSGLAWLLFGRGHKKANSAPRSATPETVNNQPTSPTEITYDFEL